MKPAVALLPLLLLAMLLPLARSFALRSAPLRAAAASARAVRRPATTPTPTSSSPSRPSVLPSSSSAATRLWMSSSSTGGTDEQVSVVEQCRGKIAAALETDDVQVVGAYDDPNGSHISIEVTSALFEGKRPVQRQQLVYKALWEELQGAVHAVDSMVCKTPAEKGG